MSLKLHVMIHFGTQDPLHDISLCVVVDRMFAPKFQYVTQNKNDKFILCFLVNTSTNHTLLLLSIIVLDRHIPLI
jgi:hypothetical protein